MIDIWETLGKDGELQSGCKLPFVIWVNTNSVFEVEGQTV